MQRYHASEEKKLQNVWKVCMYLYYKKRYAINADNTLINWNGKKLCSRYDTEKIRNYTLIKVF